MTIKTLTVKELIELLQTQPQDSFVLIEGSDSYGEATRVQLHSNGDVLIMRAHRGVYLRTKSLQSSPILPSK